MSAAPDRTAREPPTRHGTVWQLAGLSAILLLYGSFALAPDAVAGWYVPLNLAFAAGLVLWAGNLGLGPGAIGLRNPKQGLVWGLFVAGAAAIVLAIGVTIPDTRGLFDDARLEGVGALGYLYRMLVRIPLGTALLEEVAFRGVLFGLWRHRHGEIRAALGSSIVFGLWHIRPTVDLLAANDVATTPLLAGLAVAGAVVATTLGGLFFCYLRIRSGSLLAPLVAHAGINSLATAAAWTATAIG